MQRAGMLVVGAALTVWLLGTAFLGLGIMAFVDGGSLAGGCLGDGGPGGGARQVGNQNWSAEQMNNAQTIVQIAVDKKLPKRAAVIALSTAIVESSLRNINYGDRDSLGLFQQRPSQGWGTPAQVTDPVYAAGIFYGRLLAVSGWAVMPPGAAAQTVQRSAFPDRYGPQEGSAARLVNLFWKGPDNPVPSVGTSLPTNTTQLISTALCPDQGASGLPVANGPVDPEKPPAGFTFPADPIQRQVVTYALAQLNKPYVWGGQGPNSFDCSGLMRAAYASAGIAISAGTLNQRYEGTPVNAGMISPGDLVFIPGALGTVAKPGHVGMYIGHGLIVHASSSSVGIVLAPISSWKDEIVLIRHIKGPIGDPTRANAA